MDNYIIFCESPTDMRISESPAIIKTDDIAGYIKEREKKYECKYRYYSAPGIYQRDINNGTESIMNLNRFAINWYLQYDLFHITGYFNADEELSNTIDNIKPSLFATIYPELIEVFMEEKYIIKSIFCYRDKMGMSSIIITVNKNGNDITIYLDRKDQLQDGDDQ